MTKRSGHRLIKLALVALAWITLGCQVWIAQYADAPKPGHPASRHTAARVKLRVRDTLTGKESGVETPPPADFPKFKIWQAPDCGQLPISRIYLNREFGDPRWAVPSSYVYCIDLQGNVHYWRRYADGDVLDFKPHHLADGQVFYSYFVTDDSNMVNGDYYGHRVILGNEMKPVKVVSMLDSSSMGKRRTGSHDFLLEAPNTYVFCSPEPGVADLTNIRLDWSGRRSLAVAYMQRVANNKVDWEWNSLSCLRLLADSVEPPDCGDTTVPWDYCHLNSMWRDPLDGNFLVSFRGQNSVVKIEDGGGKVLWCLGGRGDEYGLTEQQLFSYQHSVSRTRQGAILLFDNGVVSRRTRIVEYYLDEEARKLTKFREVFVRRKGLPVSSYLGSVYEIGPELYLVSWGGCNSPGLEAVDVSIIRQGREIWTLSFTEPYTWSYRAFAD